MVGLVKRPMRRLLFANIILFETLCNIWSFQYQIHLFSDQSCRRDQRNSFDVKKHLSAIPGSDARANHTTIGKNCKDYPCYFKRIDGSWRPRTDIKSIFIGQRLYAVRIPSSDFLNGVTGPKVFLECGVGRIDSRGKWRIVNGMLRLSRKGVRKSLLQKKLKKLPTDSLVEVFVSKISIDNGNFEVCLDRHEALEINRKVSNCKRIPASSLKPGQEFSGSVVKLLPYGVFVDIGANRNGLLHIKKVAHRQKSYVDREKGLEKAGLCLGSKTRVVVLRNERKRLELDLAPDPLSSEKEKASNILSFSDRKNTTPPITTDSYDVSEEEALMWASYEESEHESITNIHDNETDMWASYASDSDDEETVKNNYDEDRDIEDALGIGYY